MIDTNEMIRLNREQAKYYDAIHEAEADIGRGGYAESKSAGLLTRLWANLRYRQQDAVQKAGVDQLVDAMHGRWVETKRGGDILEIGCFSGSRFTMRLAEVSGSYLGVELSAKAVEALSSKLAERGLAHKATAQVVDFLTLPNARRFDLIYAHGVLHHFENPKPLFDKLAVLAKPDACILFAEPSTVHPFYRAIRALYRPFQSDADWEWPFTRQTVAELETHFEAVEGFGWGSWSLPLSVLAGLPSFGMLMSMYIHCVRREVECGWHKRVWMNSYVAAVYRLRETAGC